MKNRLIATGVITTLIAGYGIHTYVKDTAELKQDIIEVQKVNKSLENEVKNLNVNKIKLQQELNDEVTDNNKLTEELKGKENKVKKLENQVDKLEQQLEKSKKDNESPRTMSTKVSSNEKEYIVTAYTNGVESTGKSPGDKGFGITASGATTQEGRTLSCPPQLRLGTKVKIENIGVRVCEDTGSAIQGNRLDLYIADLSKAVEFGKQRLKVEIID